jgi:hypothetical protein
MIYQFIYYVNESESRNVHREFFHHATNLLQILMTREMEGYKRYSAVIKPVGACISDIYYVCSAVGLVWKSAKDLSNIPVSNKAACRRALMQVN